VELSGTQACARTSAAVEILRHAQTEGETAAWIQPVGGWLFPPDLHDSGVDLDSLVIIHVPRDFGDRGLARAAELLLRSGAFGFVAIDWRVSKARMNAAMQGRLLGLAREHDSRVLLLTNKTAAVESLGPLVSLRIEPHRVRRGVGSFDIDPRVIKNKQGLPLHMAAGHRPGPRGLR
jgi:recombination protein RecA